MRHFNDFMDKQYNLFESMISRRQAGYDIIKHFQTYGEFFKNFRKIFIPLQQLTLYLNEHYSYSFTRDKADKTEMSEFVSKQFDDQKLKRLYQNLLSNKNGLRMYFELYK